MDTCPKCNAQQPRGNEQCQSCGVYLHKVRNPAVEVDSAPPMQETDTTGESMYPAEEGLSGTSLVAGAGAALLGALIWYLVASIFGYELGLVAWAVGGGVGFAVAATGSSGQSAGIACAVFALVAIFGGKYITYASFHDEIEQTLASSKDDVRYLYEAEMAEAQAYAGVYDDDSLRQFMVEYDYSQFYDVSEVTDEEIDYFLENFESRLRHLADSQTTFDDWYRATLDENLGNLSTTDMMMEDFGVVDIVFLLLGIATAFRLGRGTEAA